MGKEYFFSYTPQPDDHFDDIFELLKDNNDGKLLISNIKEIDAEIYAPEVNLYFQNSTDDLHRNLLEGRVTRRPFLLFFLYHCKPDKLH